MSNCRHPRRRVAGSGYRNGIETEPNETPALQQPLAQQDVTPLETLEFIRQAMESAGSFTAIPGRGMVVVGATALAVSALTIAVKPVSHLTWMLTWLCEALMAVGISIYAMVRKGGRDALVASVPARKCLLSFLPPMLTGIVLSMALVLAGVQSHAVYAGVWCLLYGTAVITGGAFSVRVVPVMGLCFGALGTLVLFLPSIWGDVAMAAGFGVMHMVFGALIARHYGG